MNYYQLIKRAGGIVRTSRLAEAGMSKHHLAKLVTQGKIVRPKRGWVALPGVDRELTFAVQHGVVLTCMTVTRRAGLWSTRNDGLHVAARSGHAHHGKIGAVTHWGAPAVPRPSESLVDSLETALIYVARCQAKEEAHAVWESAMRKGLVSRESLARLPLNAEAKRLLNECTAFSDSGLESFVLRRLTSLRLHVVPQAWLLEHRVDFLIDGWLVLQLDGSQHQAAQRDSDNMHDALLSTHGYAVVRLSYRQVLHEWPEAQHILMLRLAQGRPTTPLLGAPLM